MIKTSELNVGNVFYGVKESNNSFFRKKIYRKIDGEDWFKYDKPLRTYELVTYTVLGVLRKKLEGEWENGCEHDLETEFFLQSVDSTNAHTYTDTLDNEEKYFVDKASAMLYKKNMEYAAKELDKT